MENTLQLLSFLNKELEYNGWDIERWKQRIERLSKTTDKNARVMAKCHLYLIRNEYYNLDYYMDNICRRTSCNICSLCDVKNVFRILYSLDFDIKIKINIIQIILYTILFGDIKNIDLD